MKTFQYITIAAAAILPLLFTSCIKDDLYNTPHPDKGALMVSPDFSKHTEGLPFRKNMCFRSAAMNVTRLHRKRSAIPSCSHPPNTA